jgi:hypothetical protein
MSPAPRAPRRGRSAQRTRLRTGRGSASGGTSATFSASAGRAYSSGERFLGLRAETGGERERLDRHAGDVVGAGHAARRPCVLKLELGRPGPGVCPGGARPARAGPGAEAALPVGRPVEDVHGRASLAVAVEIELFRAGRDTAESGAVRGDTSAGQCGFCRHAHSIGDDARFADTRMVWPRPERVSRLAGKPRTDLGPSRSRSFG